MLPTTASPGLEQRIAASLLRFASRPPRPRSRFAARFVAIPTLRSGHNRGRLAFRHADLVDLLSEACWKFSFCPHKVSQPFADFLADGLAVLLVDVDRVAHGGTLVPVNPAKNQIECLETLAHDAFLDAATRSLGRSKLFFSN
jgi:hypothetical protein